MPKKQQKHLENVFFYTFLLFCVKIFYIVKHYYTIQ